MMVQRLKAKEKTDAASDTYDTKIAWLVSLENMALTLSRLRRDFRTIYRSPEFVPSESSIELTLRAERAIAELRSKLMAIWAISPEELMIWMDLGPDDYAKRMDPSRYTVSRSSDSQHGPTKKSRRKWDSHWIRPEGVKYRFKWAGFSKKDALQRYKKHMEKSQRK